MNLTELAKKTRVTDISHQGLPGELVYADCEALPSARNIAKSTSQTSKITFAGAGTLAPGAEVIVNLVIDCIDQPITLTNGDAAAVPLKTLLLAAINGTATMPAPGEFYGINAVDAGANIVDVTGRAGQKFSISFAGFGITVGGVARPPMPTVALVTSAFCSGILPYGFVVMEAENLPEHNAPPGLVAQSDMVLSLPVGDINDYPIGFVVRDAAGSFDPFANLNACCDAVCEPEGVGCNECYHVLKLCCTDREIWIPLEPFPAGATVPVDLKGTEIHYRNAPSGTNTKLGMPALKLVAAPDPTLKPMSNKAFHAVVIELGGIVKGHQMARVRIVPIPN